MHRESGKFSKLPKNAAKLPKVRYFRLYNISQYSGDKVGQRGGGVLDVVRFAVRSRVLALCPFNIQTHEGIFSNILTYSVSGGGSKWASSRFLSLSLSLFVSENGTPKISTAGSKREESKVCCQVCWLVGGGTGVENVRINMRAIRRSVWY